jgi:hypothetical protein
MLELDPEAEVKLIEDLEPGEDVLPKTIQVVPTLILNTKTGEKTLTLIKKSHMDKMISEERLQMTKVTFQDKVS